MPWKSRPATRRAGPGDPKLRIGGRAVVEGDRESIEFRRPARVRVSPRAGELTRGRSPSLRVRLASSSGAIRTSSRSCLPSRRSASASPVRDDFLFLRWARLRDLGRHEGGVGLDSTSWGRAGSSEIDGSLFMEGFCPRVGGRERQRTRVREPASRLTLAPQAMVSAPQVIEIDRDRRVHCCDARRRADEGASPLGCRGLKARRSRGTGSPGPGSAIRCETSGGLACEGACTK